MPCPKNEGIRWIKKGAALQKEVLHLVLEDYVFTLITPEGHLVYYWDYYPDTLEDYISPLSDLFNYDNGFYSYWGNNKA